MCLGVDQKFLRTHWPQPSSLDPSATPSPSTSHLPLCHCMPSSLGSWSLYDPQSGYWGPSFTMSSLLPRTGHLLFSQKRTRGLLHPTHSSGAPGPTSWSFPHFAKHKASCFCISSHSLRSSEVSSKGEGAYVCNTALTLGSWPSSS